MAAVRWTAPTRTKSIGCSSATAEWNRRGADLISQWNVTSVYAEKMAAVTAYESVFSGDQATLVDKYSAEDRYVGSLVGVQYAEAFRARSPLLVSTPEVFVKARFG